MDESSLRALLTRLKYDGLSVDDALSSLRTLPYQDLGFAKIDHHRPLRTGSPEVVMGKGKRPDQVAPIVASLSGRGHPVLVTKTDIATYEAVLVDTPSATYNDLAKAIVVAGDNPLPAREGLLVVTAGTSDLPIAEEASLTAGLMGAPATRISDVGVAGLHRLIDCLPQIQSAKVLILVAGMEAALVSVVAGLVSVPVVAVPTSVGYGSSFEGLAALLGMLNSCAPGVAVVNIDNGFGAGYLAAQILRSGSGITE